MVGWLVDVDPSFALGAPEIILYKVTIDGSFSFLEKSEKMRTSHVGEDVNVPLKSTK